MILQAYKGLEPGARFEVTSNMKSELFEKISNAWARCLRSTQEVRVGQLVPMLADETVEPVGKEKGT